MASQIDKMATGLGWETFAKATDLQKRLLFTLGAMIVYRLGTFIPLPGINSFVLEDIFTRQAGGILGMFNMFTGGALSRMTLFALNIMPYISASIIVQLAGSVLPSLIALKKEGEAGQRKMNQYTRYLTVLITIVQAYGLAVGLEAMVGSAGTSAVVNPGHWFRFTTVVSLLGGTMFIVWLGDQITARGVGNGSSLIITAGIMAGIPMGLAQTFELARAGSMSTVGLFAVLFTALALVYFVVFIERAQRRILIQYPKRQMGGRMMNSESSHLPLKLNPTGVIPPIFASSLLLLPMTIVNFSVKSGNSPDWIVTLSSVLAHGQPVYLALYAALIIFFTFFYTAVVFNPEDTADNLKRHGGFIAGIRPGKSTAEYLDYVLTRLTVVGSLYLAAICCFPEIMMAKYSVPFVLGGTTLLIVVSVTMEFATQIQSHLIAHQYEGLMKKAKLKGRLK
ncbi:MAG: preprotein translocase subunit SecY [Alphaproteobacteria bacterium]|nr:preprotein translocase subunit SecY [Alphaproteobacteria bacterium]